MPQAWHASMCGRHTHGSRGPSYPLAAGLQCVLTSSSFCGAAVLLVGCGRARAPAARTMHQSVVAVAL